MTENFLNVRKTCKTMLSADKHVYFFISNLNMLYSFFFPNCFDWEFHTVVHRSDESRCPCLNSDLVGKASSYSTLI